MRFETKLLVSRENLKSNFSNLKVIAPHNEVLFMVKANAYGHGLLPVYQYAFNELKIKSFGVASLGEGVEIRKSYQGDHSNIYIFSDLNFSNKELRSYYSEFNLIPVLSSIDHLNIFLADHSFKNSPLVLKFNTGMNRLGLSEEDLGEVIKSLKDSKREVDHLMTHFMSSYFLVKENDHTSRQYDKFLNIKKELQASGIQINKTSCSNSGAIEQKFALEETHIRPGLMLYGPHSIGAIKPKEKLWQAKNISSLKTHILRKEIHKKGTPIGYGGYVLDRDYLVLVLPIGYGDGLLTYYSGAKFKFQNTQAKLLGRVNMDMITIGLDPSEDKNFQEFQEVDLWSFDQDQLVSLANSFKTIPYQVLTALTGRIPREYI